MVKLKQKGRFAGGRDSDFWGSTAGADYSVLLTAYSDDVHQLTDRTAQKNLTKNGFSEINNLASSHNYMSADIAGGLFDYMNGAAVTTLIDSEGVPYLAYDNPALVAVEGVWIKTVGQDGVETLSGDLYSTTPETAAYEVVAVAMTKKPSANMLLFVNAHVEQDSDAAELDKIGFDVMGANRTSALAAGQDTNGAVGIKCGQAAAINDNLAGITTDMALSKNLAINTYSYHGRYVHVVAINGTTNCIGYTAKQLNGAGCVVAEVPEYGGTFRYNSCTGTEWTTADSMAMEINLGSSAGLGLYAAGIRNYDSAISEMEVARVAEFMCRTGKLPSWWL